MLQGIAEIIRAVVCLKTGEWPSRLHDVAETDVLAVDHLEFLHREVRLAHQLEAEAQLVDDLLLEVVHQGDLRLAILARLAQLLLDRRSRHGLVLHLDDDALCLHRTVFRIEDDHRIALLGIGDGADDPPSRLDRVVGRTQQLCVLGDDARLEVCPLRSAPLSLPLRRLLRCVEFDDLQMLGVLGDVGDRRLDADARLQLDQPGLLEQLQRAGAVGGIVRDRRAGAVLDVGDVLDLAGIDADRHDDALGDRDDVVAALRHLIVEIGLVLEVVDVEIVLRQRRVGDRVVGELGDLQLDALLGGEITGVAQDLRVGAGGGADANHLAGEGDGRNAQRSERRCGDGERTKHVMQTSVTMAVAGRS